MNIGERIKAARKKAGLTQKGLSKAAGISDVMISQYETGIRKPKQETIQNIADALGVPWYELYADSTEGQIQAIREEIKTQLEDAAKKDSIDSEFAALFKHPVLYDLAEQIIMLEEQRTILTGIQLKNYMPKGQEIPPYEAPKQEELDRRIRNRIAYALLDYDIRPSGYPELIELGFPEGDATYLLNYDKDNISGRGVKTEEEIKKWQSIIHILNNGTGTRETDHD